MFAVATLLYIAVLAGLGIVAVQLAGADDPVPGLLAISWVLLAVLVAVGVLVGPGGAGGGR